LCNHVSRGCPFAQIPKGIFEKPTKKGAMMKKLIQIALIALFILTPVMVKAECLMCKEKFGVKSVENLGGLQKINDASGANKVIGYSTVIHLTMEDGNEFIIPARANMNMTVTLEFASGKTIIAAPWGMSTIDGAGYQQYDNVQNNVNFMEAYVSNNCVVDIILCLAFGAVLIGLIFCIWAITSC